MSEDDLGTEARAILDAARAGDEPDAERVAHVRRRLSRNVGLAAGGAAAIGTAKGASAAASLGVAGWVKGVAVASLVLAGAGGAYVASRPPKTAPTAVVPKAAPSPSVVVEAPPVAPMVTAQPSATLVPSAIVAPKIVKSAPVVIPSSAPSDDVAGEVALLNEAQLALSEGRYARAIELYDRHAATYPFGALSQERRAGLALALCGSKRSDAVDVAKRFLASNPSPPLAARVRSACHLDE